MTERGKFMGRMGGINGKNERGYWEEWEGMLRHIGKVAWKNGRGYWEEGEETLRQIGRVA